MLWALEEHLSDHAENLGDPVVLLDERLRKVGLRRCLLGL